MNPTPHYPPSDRLAWLWLVCGALLLPLIQYQTVWPLAAWLAPVFLLHGLNDNIIPTSESSFAAEYLRSHGNGRVNVLLTPLISHADLATNLPLADSWRLIRFWSQMILTAEERR